MLEVRTSTWRIDVASGELDKHRQIRTHDFGLFIRYFLHSNVTFAVILS